jgi:hypothetical protein
MQRQQAIAVRLTDSGKNVRSGGTLRELGTQAKSWYSLRHVRIDSKQEVIFDG